MDSLTDKQTDIGDRRVAFANEKCILILIDLASSEVL